MLSACIIHACLQISWKRENHRETSTRRDEKRNTKKNEHNNIHFPWRAIWNWMKTANQSNNSQQKYAYSFQLFLLCFTSKQKMHCAYFHGKLLLKFEHRLKNGLKTTTTKTTTATAASEQEQNGKIIAKPNWIKKKDWTVVNHAMIWNWRRSNGVYSTNKTKLHRELSRCTGTQQPTKSTLADCKSIL